MCSAAFTLPPPSSYISHFCFTLPTFFSSWDRMPIKNRIATFGGDATYNMLHTDVSQNYFKANYGGAQGACVQLREGRGC